MGISDSLKEKADELLKQAKAESEQEAQNVMEQAKAKAQEAIDEKANALKEKLGLTGGRADASQPEQQAAPGDKTQGSDDQGDNAEDSEDDQG